jgi:hypothetical protein
MDPVPTPEPLNAREIDRLRAWEHRMHRFHMLAIPALVLCATAALYWSEVVWARRLFLVVVLALVAAATVLQMRERCPRCSARLRTTALVRLRQRCHYCGVAFPPREPMQ